MGILETILYATISIDMTFTYRLHYPSLEHAVSVALMTGEDPTKCHQISRGSSCSLKPLKYPTFVGCHFVYDQFGPIATHAPNPAIALIKMPRSGTSTPADAFPLLPPGPSTSRPTSVGPSRRTSGERTRKVRLSDDIDGEASGRSSPVMGNLHARRSVEHPHDRSLCRSLSSGGSGICCGRC
jgi:hypothetical protein